MSDIITLANQIAVEKENIRQAIESRGVSLPASAPLSEYAGKIPLIEAQVSEGDYYWKGTAYDHSQTSYTIPGNYDAIDDYAFNGESNLQSVNLNNVRYVGDGAFACCPNLTNFTADNVFKIGDNVLTGCTSITSFSNTSAKIIGDNFLYNCPLTTLRLGAERVGANINSNNSELTSVDLTGVKSIGNMAFYNCDHLDTIVAPDLEEIGDGAFRSINNWNYDFDQSTLSLSFPELKKVGQNAFYGTKGLVSITMPKVEIIEEEAFDYTGSNDNRITTLNVPNCRHIGNNAFRYTYNNNDVVLNSITVANGCELFGQCFYNMPFNVNGKIGAIYLGNNQSNMRCQSPGEYNIDFSGLHTITSSYAGSDSYIFAGENSSHGTSFNGEIDLRNLVSIIQYSSSHSLKVLTSINYTYYKVSKVWINKNLVISNPNYTSLLANLTPNTHIYTDADAKQSSWTNVGGSGTWHFNCSHDDFENGIFN